jgi:hypothetical protein
MANDIPPLEEILDRGEWSDYTMDSLTGGASGIVIGTNPPYSAADFLGMYPQFDNKCVPEPVLVAYISLASACLVQARWCDMWQVAMGLFIAHYITLYLQTASAPPGSTAAQIAGTGLAFGVKVAKSVGDLSISYQILEAGLDQWGAYNLTAYGQQLATLANAVGSGILWVF